MKFLNLKDSLYNLLPIVVIIIFLTSCEQESIVIPNEELNIRNTISPVYEQKPDITVKEPSHSVRENYVTNVYRRDVHTATTNSLRAAVNVPLVSKDKLTVDVEKHVGNARVIKPGGLDVIIAAEVREPD